MNVLYLFNKMLELNFFSIRSQISLVKKDVLENPSIKNKNSGLEADSTAGD